MVCIFRIYSNCHCITFVNPKCKVTFYNLCSCACNFFKCHFNWCLGCILFNCCCIWLSSCCVWFNSCCIWFSSCCIWFFYCWCSFFNNKCHFTIFSCSRNYGISIICKISRINSYNSCCFFNYNSFIRFLTIYSNCSYHSCIS